jgi:formylglycine-generating enzyme required for sulfatase activity
MVAQPATLAPAAPAAAKPASAPTGDAAARKPFAQEIPAAAFKFNLVPIPGSADGTIKPFYMSEKEITWEAADTYIYKIDEERGSPPPGGTDAVSRPTKPYIPPDRGFGHEGYAALTMSFKNASEFCVWLSKHSGRNYRLPTEAEWEHAARAGSPTDPGAVDAKALEQIAWFEDNSDGTPHPVGAKRANAWGLYDMLGNVQEWCVAPDGKGVTRGGSYRNSAEKIKASQRETEPRAWNNSDPQIPKSKWWLADAPFVGFRIVCDSETPVTPAKTPAPAKPATPVQPAAPRP